MRVDGPIINSSFGAEVSHQIQYPVQFFNLYYFNEPKSYDEMFKWSRWLYDNVGVVKQAIRKMAIYPVTYLVVDGDIEDEFWSKFLSDTIKIRSVAQEIGFDYFVYGNAILSVIFPFIKQFTCPKCKHSTTDYKRMSFKSFKFQGKCDKCGYTGAFDVKDQFIKDPSKIRVKRWYPGSLLIERHPITGELKIFYKISKKMTTKVKNGKDIWYIANLPQPYIDAIAKEPSKPYVELVSDYTFIMSLPEPTYEDSKNAKMDEHPLSYPLVSGAWRDIYLLINLKKAQEAIAADRIVSMRILFPGVQTENPIQNINLAAFKYNVSSMLKQFYKDPNRIGIAPIPINQLHIGGDFRPYNPAPEIEAQNRTILADIGVPYEFVFGGLQYSGASVSIRMLENLLLNYRESLEEFLRFFVKQCALFLQKQPPKDVRFTDFKMADDIQKKQMLFSMNQMEKVSDQTLLKEFDISAKEETDKLKEELQIKAPYLIEKARVMAKVSVEGQQIQTMGGAIANAQGAQMQEALSAPVSPEAYAKYLLQLDEQSRQLNLQRLAQADPPMYGKIIQLMQQPVDMTPLPEQKPPTRSPDKGVI